MKLALAIALLAACGIEQDVKDLGADVAEVTYCQFTDCGTVLQCDLDGAYYRAAPASQHTTTPELCWLDDSADELAAALSERFPGTTCAPTPRGGVLGWPCLYGCEKGHKDCNAYQGCYCN